MSISKFYERREVFVTGVTGSLGKVLLEKLLRSCNNEKIYVLIRSKKGMPAEKRKMELFRSKIFENVLLKNPEITNKVECIEGDLTRENLGISSLHMNLITKNVSVVFHLAASVKFDEPFRDSFVNNVETTKNVVEVCRRMKNLVAFVHASTAYSFCDRKEVDEKIYTMARSFEEFKNIANVENNASVEITEENLLENRPNTYTLTKAITENYLNNFCRDLPIVIVRPSAVGCTWKEPFSGWNDGNSGTDYVAAIGLKGILRSAMCDEAKIFDFVPSDAVVNLMLAAAWRKSIMPHQRRNCSLQLHYRFHKSFHYATVFQIYEYSLLETSLGEHIFISNEYTQEELLLESCMHYDATSTSCNASRCITSCYWQEAKDDESLR
ncbi:putative fatty acyl-CoA reductase CG5065 isoform X2 [Centruroides sculpturatus]|uniref:putative fatty acyl-CoA reductase CG5065 isoform X2 n=1 Tax=Centruroides sculpturatus TaxID=218467 RepID=UPI000C6D4096|nr:putative fatty acyl-CoA reductase CG5065 isoform X2 [Centruroides sculpturatus]